MIILSMYIMNVRSIGTLFCNILSVILFEIIALLLKKEG